MTNTTEVIEKLATVYRLKYVVLHTERENLEYDERI